MGAKSVLVGEGPGHQRDTFLVLAESGLEKELQSRRIRFVDLNHDKIPQGGPKLRESKVGGEPDLKMNRSIVVAQAMPMEHFVTLLMRTGRVPVVDLTGLLGRYNFSFELAKYVTPDTPLD